MEHESWAPPEVDVERANVARVYDALLGGSHNFAVDRDVASALTAIEPTAREAARANRAFLGRAVRFLADAGIRQFLDIGSGVPTLGNVHEIAQAAAPDSQVVYVDTDPVAIAHSKSILAGNDRATIVHADLRDPEAILGHPEVTRLIDFDRPVAVLLVAVLHFITDEEDPGDLVRRLRTAMAPGSFLTISHGTLDGRSSQVVEAVEKLYSRASAPGRPRDHASIEAFFDGFDLIDPGLVYLPLWHPDPADVPFPDPAQSWGYAGVARRS
ncbi:SAM-dependent methyltransferase [Actinomadura sp. DC4]|uniref:SAM-dependent methyltransferase n=1 Tax=Actinomadura sp. DC4 TaxID=3055069 RepID=UPI0025B26B48|nr:SAM-dependent methyltransferase [Actinomadura sp. DC4]MDN3351546.1 SAM-dependent methyltransferase [Actinomadura sp. DC4]